MQNEVKRYEERERRRRKSKCLNVFIFSFSSLIVVFVLLFFLLCDHWLFHTSNNSVLSQMILIFTCPINLHTVIVDFFFFMIVVCYWHLCAFIKIVFSLTHAHIKAENYRQQPTSVITVNSPTKYNGMNRLTHLPY